MTRLCLLTKNSGRFLVATPRRQRSVGNSAAFSSYLVTTAFGGETSNAISTPSMTLMGNEQHNIMMQKKTSVGQMHGRGQQQLQMDDFSTGSTATVTAASSFEATLEQVLEMQRPLHDDEETQEFEKVVRSLVTLDEQSD